MIDGLQRAASWLLAHVGDLGAWLGSHGIALAALVVGLFWTRRLRRESGLRRELDLCVDIFDLIAELMLIVRKWTANDVGNEDAQTELVRTLAQQQAALTRISARISLLMPPTFSTALAGMIEELRVMQGTPEMITVHRLESMNALAAAQSPEEMNAILQEGRRSAFRRTKVDAPKAFEEKALRLMDELRVRLHGRRKGHRLNAGYRSLVLESDGLFDTSSWEKFTSLSAAKVTPTPDRVAQPPVLSSGTR